MKNIRDVYIMKKLLKVFIISLICISLCSCAKKKELKDDIYIFFTSDVHRGVDQGVGLDGLKALVDDTKKEHEYVTLVDCGNYIQGGAIVEEGPVDVTALIEYARSLGSFEGRYTDVEGRIIVQ